MGESECRMDNVGLRQAVRIGRAVETISRYTPWESKCLVQAVVGKIMLRRLGLANTLYLGVRGDGGNGLQAHAWLRCGDVILTGGSGRKEFTVVSKFADGGSVRS